MLKAIFVGFLAVGTAGAYLGSARGWGLDSSLKKPVSIRQESQHRRSGGVGFLYFGTSRYRSHMGGGYRGGK